MEGMQERIEQYLTDKMSEEDRHQFEADIQKDKALAAAFNQMATAFAYTQAYGRSQLKSKMDKWDEEMSGESNSLLRSLYSFRWAIAAAALLLIASFLLWRFSPNPSSAEQLYATNYTPYVAPPNLRSENISALSNWQMGSTTYAQGDYAKALKAFELAQSENEVAPYLVKFFQAQSLMAMDQSEDDRVWQLLEEVSQSESDYKEVAYWYLALIAVKKEEWKKADSLLAKISNFSQEQVKSLRANIVEHIP